MAAPFRPHLLVVDDEACIREALTAALGAIYHVHAAASGAEAVAFLTAHPIAGIILDVQLGEEQGLDLIPRFRTLSDAPILVLTGHSTEDLAIQAVDAQVAKYLKKPPAVADLLAALRRLVPETDSATDLAERAHQYLDDFPDKRFLPVDLAEQFGVSEAHLRRCFREVHGQTPRRYLVEVRLRRAAARLRATADRVEQIAADVGYPSSTRFGKSFRQLYGLTPLQYRATPAPPAPKVRTLPHTGRCPKTANLSQN